jgi:hypothetical protein
MTPVGIVGVKVGLAMPIVKVAVTAVVVVGEKIYNVSVSRDCELLLVLELVGIGIPVVIVTTEFPEVETMVVLNTGPPPPRRLEVVVVCDDD